MSEPKYDVLTWDSNLEEYSEQDGMTVPSRGVSWCGMLAALRELRRKWGYLAHRDHEESDPSVLVQRMYPTLGVGRKIDP